LQWSTKPDGLIGTEIFSAGAAAPGMKYYTIYKLMEYKKIICTSKHNFTNDAYRSIKMPS